MIASQRVMAPEEILLPAKPGFIAFTLIAALLLNLLPWSGYLLWFRPDFVALVTLYWCIQQPHRMGFFAAWTLGLLMDVADATLFGQHALAYSILAYAGIWLHRRVRMFPLGAQMLHVIPLLLVNDLIVLLIHMMGGSEFPGFRYFIGSFIGGALWPPLAFLLTLPQRPGSESDG
ncbi:MAG TPA: rod shape-determining protein MreD [Burkholderiales bacterium]|nr:rod shape-determining protein MreD [Burkholderiales bacterium]